MSAARTFHVRARSRVAAPAERVWAHATSISGVNEELAPLRMSSPPGARLADDVPLGRPLFVSRVTLAGIIPIDLHELTLQALDPGRSFHESSRTLLERRWMHHRRVEPVPGGCEVEDDVTFEPRLAGALVARVVAFVFRRRHQVLRAKFGGLADGPPLGVDLRRVEP